MTDGKYDCITGTGLYTLLLKRYDIPYIIEETDAHVYLSGEYNGIKELAGLQYDNDAMLKFNQKAYQAAYTQLIKAAYLYPSPRIFQLKEKMEMMLLGL